MELTKVFYLDENYKYPICPECKNEFSPFCVTSAELNEFDTKTLDVLIQSELLRINVVEKDKHIIFICKTCCPPERIK